MQQLVDETLDDLLLKVFPTILKQGDRVKASKGWNTELSGIVLELLNPLARLSRTETKGTVFSCLGETLWYLARSDQLKFIKYYLSNYGQFAESDGTIHGAYGPRLFGMRSGINQIDNVIKLLQRKPSSRQAVVQLFNAEDLLKDYKDTLANQPAPLRTYRARLLCRGLFRRAQITNPAQRCCLSFPLLNLRDF